MPRFPFPIPPLVLTACLVAAPGLPVAPAHADPILEAGAQLPGEAPEAALSVLRPLAEAGDPRAQALLGLAYLEGLGVDLDGPQARLWLERAAEAGHPPAHWHLGRMFEIGLQGATRADLVFDPDPEAARAQYLAGAALDHPPALSAAGMMLIEARGGPQDSAAGLRLLARAVELGDPQGHAMLGLLHMNGVHVPRDDALARHHSLIAALQGHEGATERLVRMMVDGIGGPVDLPGARGLLTVAAEAGSPGAAFDLGRLILDNPEAFDDPVTGLAWCLSAERRHSAFAGGCDADARALSPEDRETARTLSADLPPPD